MRDRFETSIRRQSRLWAVTDDMRAASDRSRRKRATIPVDHTLPCSDRILTLERDSLPWAIEARRPREDQVQRRKDLWL